MKNIQFLQVFTFSIFISLFLACASEPAENEAGEPSQQAMADKAEMSAKAGAIAEDGPSDADLAAQQFHNVDPGFLAARDEAYSKILQAKWENANDPEQTLEISGNKLKYFKSGNLVSESTIEIDADCQKATCKGGEGWCFIENTGNGTRCQMIVRVNPKVLTFRQVGSKAGSEVSYKKILKENE